MDAATLQRWYEAYGFAVHRRCLRLLGSAAEADDALHEVFVRAHRYADTLRDADPLGWLYRICDRHCLDVLARRRRYAPAEQAQRAIERRADAPSTDPSPDQVHLVAQVLAACSERVRDAATLYFVDGLTQDEVAEALGCSRKTVKEKLARFRESAAELLQLNVEVEP
jgi:RNA polymerase sigma-70 factor (ECF subfamily)